MIFQIYDWIAAQLSQQTDSVFQPSGSHIKVRCNSQISRSDSFLLIVQLTNTYIFIRILSQCPQQFYAPSKTLLYIYIQYVYTVVRYVSMCLCVLRYLTNLQLIFCYRDIIVKQCCLLFLDKFIFIYFISQAKFNAWLTMMECSVLQQRMLTNRVI